MIEVTLTLSEIRMAATIGLERQMSAIKRRLKNKNGYKGDDSWGVHINGALAEIVVAKHLNLFFRGDVDKFKAPDVGEFQVRYTRTDPPVLIIRAGDNDDEKFICVTGDSPTFFIHGWMKASDGKQKQWKKAPFGRPPAYFIPISLLHPVDTIYKKEPKVKMVKEDLNLNVAPSERQANLN